MKELINKIFKRIKTEGSSIIDSTYLKDNSWFYVSDNILEVKKVYIFRSNRELLISENGIIIKAQWEYLYHATNSIVIDINNEAILYNILYLTSDYLVLQQDGTDLFKVFIKQERFRAKLPKEDSAKSIEFIFDDLKELLNDKQELGPSEARISYHGGAISDGVNQTNTSKSPDIDLTFRKFTPDGFKHFNILEIIKHNQRIGAIKSKEEESELIILLHKKKDDMISSGELCPDCRAENSIKNGTCLACGKSV